MVLSCSVKGCRNESYPGCGVSFHKFPSREEIRQKWIDIVPIRNKISKNSFVCSHHFKKTDFARDYRYTVQQLKPEAVPSIFPSELVTPSQIKYAYTLVVGVGSSREGSTSPPPTTHPQPSSPAPGPSSFSFVPCPASHIDNCSDEPPEQKFCPKIDVAVQTETYKSPREDKLRRELKIMRLRLKRRTERLDKLKIILKSIKQC